MQITAAQVFDFRNLTRIDSEFSPGVNVIHGSNAQGKTNLLEALCMLVTGRSFRGAPDRDLLPWERHSNYEATIVRAQVLRHTGEDKFVLSFNQQQKFIRVNGTPLSRLGELVGRFNCVLFTPSDLALVTGAPAGRRRFIDLLLSQVNPHYFHHLQHYDRALRQCNAMLKHLRMRPNAPRTELLPWQEQMAQHGGEVMAQRHEWLLKVRTLAADAYRWLSPDSERELLTLAYTPQVSAAASAETAGEIANVLRDIFTRNTNDDVIRGTTSAGPHRDDIVLRLHGRSVQDFASQGQQRSTVIALKMAELNLLTTATGESPVLMLDDLLSELDEFRRRALIDHLPSGIQTFITTTDAELISALPKVERTFRMDGGQLA